jgi:primary-amine oxidase
MFSALAPPTLPAMPSMSRLLAAAFVAASSALLAPLGAQAPQHPLDGLSGREHWTIYNALVNSGRTDSTTSFLYVGLKEPAKAEVLAWRPGQPYRREALVHVVQGDSGYEAIVDLTANSVRSWTPVPARQFMTFGAEFGKMSGLVLEDARVRNAIRARGITDFTHVDCGANHGYLDLPEERGKRTVHVTCSDSRGVVTGYGAEIEGLVIVVDLTEGKILRVTDSGVRPMGGPYGAHDAEAIGPTREVRNAVQMVQPLGPSYTVNGQQVRWQNWDFHFRVDPRRGVVLSLVSYTDGGAARPVMYQGSLSELFVPYMDAEDPWNYQGFFDLGTYPALFGGIASSLEPGVECPEYATYFNAMVVTDKGMPRERVRAACLFERSAGDVAWRHGRERGSLIDTRPKRDLVLRMFMTAGNYDYLFDWVFQQDGTLRMDAGASGMDATKTATGTDADERYGRRVSAERVGVNHSHFFSFRLDMDVDGPQNSLLVDRLVPETLPADNPRRSLWTVQTAEAQRERDAMRHSTMNAPEIWRIVNPSRPGPYGGFTGYQIDGHGAMTLLAPDDYLQRRAGFTNHTLWVTPYNQRELYAAGDYPTMSTAGEGLPKWTGANRPIANTDVVAWLTMGFHHVPRPEDWPLMPVAKHSFEIRPVGFFSRNPAIDLPKSPD